MNSSVQDLGVSKEEIKARLMVKPYKLAIDNLRKVRNYETPIDKMRCITQTSKCIVKSIDHFWKNVKVLEKSKLTLDADQLLMIFIFVTLRSKVTEMLAHVKFINEFSTDQVRKSKLGFYASTLEVAVQQVLSMDKDGMFVDFEMVRNTRTMSLIGQERTTSTVSSFPLQLAGGEGFDVF
mmetsp:Transcript_45812/g.33549  ORF Transcript_45812/g.33549 Transcript_45812/m.33549 type:complete len:180 (-) Transcript_45812:119-658(-)